MTRKLYIRPVGCVASPQSENGEAVRIAGGMVYCFRFALVVREGTRVISRELVAAPDMAAALARLPAELGVEGEAQWANLRMAHPPLQLAVQGGTWRTVRFDQPQIMGILNVTPDSFSDGGKFLDDPDNARDHSAGMLEAGAAIIDVGGESTRPGAPAVWEGDELKRVLPAIESLAAMGAAISVDTRRVGVMEAALKAGAHIVNDVSALRHDPRALEFVASTGVPVILMHAPGDAAGDGSGLHECPEYDNPALDVFDWLKERCDAAIAAGIGRERIILDPGIGFGKSLAHNLAVLNALPLYHALGQPLLLGASRKRFIGALSNEAPVHERIGGSIAVAIAGMNAGVQILRVHDVAASVQARNVWRGMRDAALTDFSELPGE